MNYAIETINLSKEYGSVHAVDQVNLKVKQGEIYGFLGLNGAGKTTTIRALVGMIRPSAGSVKVLDQAVGPNGRGPWARVGHLVESPSAYPELSVRENLQVSQHLHGITEKNAVDNIMEKLSIASYADREAGTLSMGNLQRLGLARALLHNPELLILDEPSNALDPAGIVEIRELLRELAHKQRKTIFMSSHILSEVNLLADRIGIIHKGKLIEELDTARLEEIRTKQLIVHVKNKREALAALAKFDPAEQDEAILIKDRVAVNAPEMIATLLVNAGAPPTHLSVEQENLEEYFLRLTRTGSQ